MTMNRVRLALWRPVLVAAAALGAGSPAVLWAQPRASADLYDDAFRKQTKRQFGPGFDWRIFKAQGMAESNLDSTATSRVGARGVMQLMPGTFREIASRNPELERIDNPEMNIAAGIAYDRQLWVRWEKDSVNADLARFVFASYNAGRTTMLHAQQSARAAALDPRQWRNIETVAPQVPRWGHVETLGYVRRIAEFTNQLDDRGRLVINGTTSRGLKR